ncbi:MAG: IS3 family transposase [Bdellovibrionota bacterium]|nr:IS3 family transposase [Bdellovibrionota bacterium]
MITSVKSESSLNLPIRFLCRHFRASTSGYYHWKKRSSRIRFATKSAICKRIKEIFIDSGETYGSPRIFDSLKDEGIAISENTVAKYMRELELDARLKKRYWVQTTDSNHYGPIAPRLFKAEDDDSLPPRPGELIAGDITYLKLGGSFLYLAVVIDLFNREIVGWSMRGSLETQLVLDALDMAMER